MTVRVGLGMVLGLLLMVDQTSAQNAPWQGPPPGPVTGPRPDQPVVPPIPTLQLNPAQAQQAIPPNQASPQQSMQPPFTLTPHEEAQLDKVLNAWEQSSSRVKTFEADFTRFEYDQVFGKPNEPKSVEQGQVRFAAPDRGLFAIDGPQPEKWVCDGKSIYEYDFKSKLLTEHRLPPELQGKAISDGPLPFLFGAPAAQLKERYFLKTVTPKEDQQVAIWLQALPRFQREKANFDQAILIIDAKSLQPAALRIYQPGGKSCYTFVFTKIRVNDPLGFLRANPFAASTPFGWRRVAEDAPQVQVSQQQNPLQRGRRQ